MVELASKKFVCIVDESKLVDGLGGSKGKSHVHPNAPSVQLCSVRVVRACWCIVHSWPPNLQMHK